MWNDDFLMIEMNKKFINLCDYLFINVLAVVFRRSMIKWLNLIETNFNANLDQFWLVSVGQLLFFFLSCAAAICRRSNSTFEK